jgi:hypothetical protein
MAHGIKWMINYARKEVKTPWWIVLLEKITDYKRRKVLQ